MDKTIVRQFRQSIVDDLRGRKYRAAYLAETISAFHDGEFAVGKRMLCNYVNASIGFDSLSQTMRSTTNGLARMLGPKGKPRAAELFVVLKHLREADGLEVRVLPSAKQRKHG